MIEIKIQGNTVKEIHTIIREILANTDATGAVEVTGFVATPVPVEPPPVVVDIPAPSAEEVVDYLSGKEIPDDIPPPTTNEYGADLDADGAVWDARIHSTGRSKTKKGIWKILRKPKRFETDEEWKKYVAEIQEIAAVDDEPINYSKTVNAAVLHDTQPVQDIPPVVHEPTHAQILQQEPVVQDIPEENILAPITDFNEFINWITNGPCPMEYNLVLEIAKKYGMVNSMMEFATPDNQGKIPLMYNEIMGIA